LVLAAVALVEIIAVALLEPIRSALTAEVLVLSLVASTSFVLAVALTGSALFADDLLDWRPLATFRLTLVASVLLALLAVALLELIRRALADKALPRVVVAVVGTEVL